ncbi:MAG: hypothetical protein ACJATT_005675 [Myxococcota bacterium]|jgi:hypothetical protein
MSNVLCRPPSFVYPVRSRYDPYELFGSLWGVTLPHTSPSRPETVVLRFVSGWKPFLLRQILHVKQREVRPGPDECVDVELALHITYDLVRWVRGHGREVVVQEPAHLKGWVESNGGFNDFEKWVTAS